MNSQTIVYCVVLFLLGMLLAHMLKNVCGCKVVEGTQGSEDTIKNNWLLGDAVPDKYSAKTLFPRAGWMLPSNDIFIWGKGIPYLQQEPPEWMTFQIASTLPIPQYLIEHIADIATQNFTLNPIANNDKIEGICVGKGSTRVEWRRSTDSTGNPISLDSTYDTRWAKFAEINPCFGIKGTDVSYLDAFTRVNSGEDLDELKVSYNPSKDCYKYTGVDFNKKKMNCCIIDNKNCIGPPEDLTYKGCGFYNDNDNNNNNIPKSCYDPSPTLINTNYGRRTIGEVLWRANNILLTIEQIFSILRELYPSENLQTLMSTSNTEENEYNETIFDNFVEQFKKRDDLYSNENTGKFANIYVNT